MGVWDIDLELGLLGLVREEMISNGFAHARADLDVLSDDPVRQIPLGRFADEGIVQIPSATKRIPSVRVLASIAAATLAYNSRSVASRPYSESGIGWVWSSAL